MKQPRFTCFFIALLVLMASGCATNPVTGKNELSLISESTELKIGKEQYLPTRQMQGGDYRADPQLTAYVKEVGRSLAAVSDRKLPYEFVVLNSSVPNAWALPGGKIAVNRGLLLELDNEAELAAVLGHEVVHAAAKHSAQGMQRGTLMQGAVMAVGVAASMATDDKRWAGLAVGGAALGSKLINQKYGRDAELEADLYGMQYMVRAGYDPRAAISLQETFVRLSKEQRQDWLSGLFASHPPSQERVQKNRETAKRLGGDQGKLDREGYQRAIAHLNKTKPAYDAYEKGVKAAKADNLDRAEQLANRALAIEPKEGKFHALLGDVSYARKDYKQALKRYDKALALNPDYFAFYQQRGLTKQQLGDLSGARQDLSRSTRLLPNASGYNSLGQLALAEGDGRQAKAFFRKAAGSQTGPGREAMASLMKLDLPANPNQYLKVSLGVNARGDLLAYVSNPTPLNVREVRLLIEYRESGGGVKRWQRTLPGILKAGNKVRMDTELGPVTDRNLLRRLRVSVDRASPAP